MKVLIFGGSGMLGHKLWQVLRERFNCWVTVRSLYAYYSRFNLFSEDKLIDKVNVLNFDSILRTFAIVRPDVVINAIGIVKQSPAVKDPSLTITVNSLFPHRLNHLCSSTKRKWIRRTYT